MIGRGQTAQSAKVRASYNFLGYLLFIGDEGGHPTDLWRPLGRDWRQKESRDALESCSATSSCPDPAGFAYIWGMRTLNPTLDRGPQLG